MLVWRYSRVRVFAIGHDKRTIEVYPKNDATSATDPLHSGAAAADATDQKATIGISGRDILSNIEPSLKGKKPARSLDGTAAGNL